MTTPTSGQTPGISGGGVERRGGIQPIRSQDLGKPDMRPVMNHLAIDVFNDLIHSHFGQDLFRVDMQTVVALMKKKGLRSMKKINESLDADAIGSVYGAYWQITRLTEPVGDSTAKIYLEFSVLHRKRR
jgi:hypothetical protein